jgi:uracil-DNA glycosylase family 4
MLKNTFYLKNMTKQPETNLLEEISKILQYHNSLGIKEYPRSRQIENFLHKLKKPSPLQSRSKLQGRQRKAPEADERKHLFDPGLAKKATLQDVRDELGDCQRCPLHATRTNIVFGQGPTQAKLMIVTGAPGTEDDQKSAPVQGNAGGLLEKMLTAIGLSREDVYITNLVKCFPGGDVKPAESEIKTCLPFLFRQIEIICPTVICTMGMLAAQTLLHSRKSLFQLRGRFYNFNDLCSGELKDKIVIMPSLHPSLLLDNSELKKASWQDLQMIQKKLAED